MERKANKTPGKPKTVVAVGHGRIGFDAFPVIAGPCAIVSGEQSRGGAQSVSECGAAMLRGGAWKSTSAPYVFRGLGEEAVDMRVAAGEEVELPTVTQVLEASHVEKVAGRVDRLEIAAGNMQDFGLVRA